MSDGLQGFLTKHEQIMDHIENLSAGTRISVRKIAQMLEVSEGTAYRAIKEAENLGLVTTKERIGTIRVDKKERQHFDKLTFAEVVNIVDGEVLGGAAGLHKPLNKFVIGAMQLEAMKRYIEPDNLLIVGNRSQAQLYALGQGAGVLVTGGFHADEEARKLADELELPIISSSYDTFTVATMINRAILRSSDQEKKFFSSRTSSVRTARCTRCASQIRSTICRSWSTNTGTRGFPSWMSLTARSALLRRRMCCVRSRSRRFTPT